MAAKNVQLLTYDPSGVMLPGYGLCPADIEQLAPWLEAARHEVLEDEKLWASGKTPPVHKLPLDAGFMRLPERLLEAYAKDRAGSELGRILATAQRLREEVDRVVVLGIGGSYMGARALLESCCHPYYNEQGRAERGGCPRIYFEGNNVDNDGLQGLLDLLGSRNASSASDRWGLVVISKSGGTLETAVAFRLLLDALRRSTGDDAKRLAQLVIPVTGTAPDPATKKHSKLFELARAIGCPEMFDIPDGVGGRFSIFTAVGLLPAALLGIDIVALLQGAAEMNKHFTSARPGENVVLNYVGVGHAMEQRRGATIRVLSTWGKGLEAAGLWYDQLLAESLGKHEHGATPLTVVNTRDLHSRGQQHQEGRRDKLITNVIVDEVRRDRLAVPKSAHDQDDLNKLAGKSIPDILEAAIAGTNQAYREARRPTAELHLPRLDPATMGQFFQMLMLATAVEGRLTDINPYGQPGVEAYKKHMTQNLLK
jgi:glucose-6-phosphate isomerase